MARSNPQASSKAAAPAKAKAPRTSAPKAAPAPVAAAPSSESDADDDDSGSDDQVSQSGLDALVKALGEDGLDDMDRAQLEAIAGDAEADSDDEEEDDDAGLQEDHEEDEEEEDAAPIKPVGPPKSSKSGDTLAASLARSGLIPEPESELEEESEEEEGDEAIEYEEGSEEDEDSDGAGQSSKGASWKKKAPAREKINNEEAMRRIRDDMSLNGGSLKGKGPASLPWIEHMMLTYDKSIQEEMGTEEGAADDDLKRELAFYKQALHSAVAGRALVEAAGVAFNRPSDFYAEQVKSDEHMERVRQRLLDESAGIKASEEAKRQRELKKFGKKVQVEKQLERQKSKKDLQERVKGLKRKHGELDATAQDDFDVRLDAALSGEADKPARGGSARGAAGRSKMPRTARDEKYGFGGKVGRRAKQNTRESTNDFGPSGSRGRGGARGGRGGARGGRGGARGGRGASRPGKERRASGRA